MQTRPDAAALRVQMRRFALEQQRDRYMLLSLNAARKAAAITSRLEDAEDWLPRIRASVGMEPASLGRAA